MIENEGCVRLRRNTDPINPTGWQPRPIGLYRQLTIGRMEFIDESSIQLQQWLATSADHEWSRRRRARRWPLRDNGLHQVRGGRERSAIRANANKIRVTELADGA